MVKAYRDRMKKDFRLIPPVTVKEGPILENIDRDEEVDLFKFPVPMIHEKDGGRYIGTYDIVIMQRSRHRLGQSRHLSRGGA